MFCPNCGSNNPDYVAVCGSCGTALRETQQNPYHQQYHQPYQQPQPIYPQYQQPYQQPASYATPIKPIYPMKWFKFLIYFLLFFSAVMNAAVAVSYFQGLLYINPYTGENIADLVYNEWPTLQTLDILMGLFAIASAIFAVVVRFRLSGYYKDAVNYVFAFYLISAVVNLLYAIAVFAIIGADSEVADLSSTFTGFAVQLAIAFANKTYFAKRKDLFTR